MEFTKIYNDHYDKIFNWINWKIKNTPQAEELAADVMMKVHKNLSDFDSEKSQLGTWIMNITKNAIIDYWRTNKQGMFTSLSEFEDDEGNDMLQPSNYLTPETELVNNEIGEHVMDAIISLPSKYQTIIDKFFIEEKSHEEISTELNIPIGTAKGMIHRAKKMLQTRLSNF